MLQRELLRRKNKEQMQDNTTSSSGNLGIKSNPLKNIKNQGGEDKKKGRKPHKQVLEETRALLIDSGTGSGTTRHVFLTPNQKLNMKIFSWNIRGLNVASKHRILRKKLNQVNADLVMLQETKCDSRNMELIARKIWKLCDLLCSEADGASGGLALLWNPKKIKVDLVSQSKRIHNDLLQDSWVGGTGDSYPGLWTSNSCRQKRFLERSFVHRYKNKGPTMDSQR
jgi:hypothetical protein